MALKTLISQNERLAMAVRKHVDVYGTDNKVECIVWYPVSGFLVDSFSVDPEKGPTVSFYRQTSGPEREVFSYPVSELNVADCKTLLAVIEENADALTYQKNTKEMYRQTELAQRAEELMKRYFEVSGSGSKLVAKNNVTFAIDGNRVDFFSFNPEKNRNLGGQYDLVLQGGKTVWIWELSCRGLEKLNGALQENISLARKQAKAHSKGVNM